MSHKTKGFHYPVEKPEKRSGWSDTTKYVVEKVKGKYPALKPHPKRAGWNDTGRYEDGGIVGDKEDQARLKALKQLEQDMAILGGESLFGELKQKFKDGGIVESELEIEEVEEDNSSNSIDFDELSRSELIELLKRRK